MEPPEIHNVDETGKNENRAPILMSTRLTAFDTIVKSLFQIPELKNYQERFTKDESFTQLCDFFIRDPSPMVLPNNMFAAIMELLTNWSEAHVTDKEPLSSIFEVCESAQKTCNRCNEETKYPDERSYGVNITANTLREIKYAFMHFTFEKVIKTIKIILKMPCNKEGCEKDNYVQRVIKKLPFVFTIVLEWEYNETEEEIRDTASVLRTVIDIKEIYKYEGSSLYTKYRLVSMVCECGGSYFGYGEEVTGDLNNFVSVFVSEKRRPVILFYEKFVKSDSHFGFGSLGQNI